MLQNDQEIANELNIFFKDTDSNLEINENPYIINQVSDDILDLVEKCINKYKFHPSTLLIKNRINIQNLFSFHAIERNDMMTELLKIDPQIATTGIHPIHQSADHKKDAKWLQDMRSEVNVKKQEKLDTTTGSLKKILGRMPNWKSPDPDLVQGFWSKTFSSLHERVRLQLKECLVGSCLVG